MGRSGKPDVPYRFADHARYLDAWFDSSTLDSVVLVGHDWGGALAFDWAARHSGRTRGVAFMETIVRPMTWDDFPDPARPRYEALRAPGVGETKVLDENFFIETALRSTVLSGLSDEEQEVYRSHTDSDSRRPLLSGRARCRSRASRRRGRQGRGVRRWLAKSRKYRNCC